MDQDTLTGKIDMAGLFGRDYKSSAKTPTQTHALDSTLKDIIDLYDKVMRDYSPSKVGVLWEASNVHTVFSHIQSLPSCPTSTTIQQFLLMSQSYELQPDYGSTMGIFVSGLIQRAHQEGQNYFLLDVRALKPLRFLCLEVKEERNESLVIMIHGDLGSHCINSCQGGTYFLENSLGSCGSATENSTIYISGNTGPFCATGSQGSTFYTPNHDLYHTLRSNGHKVTRYTSSEWNTLWAGAEQKIRDNMR